MTSVEFDQACQFISTDVGREIELARLNANGELGIQIAPGGGNLLAALGLLCYTEFGGKLRFGYKKTNGADASKRNFTGFFELLGPRYAAFAQKHAVYDVLRCGLAHEYYAKKNCTIYMLSEDSADGVGIDASGRYVFIVDAYFRALRHQLQLLRDHLFPPP